MKNRRNGKSLIEMLAVMSILSVIMSVAGVAFAVMMKSDRAAQAAAVSRANLSRLSVQFRNDVRTAAKAELGPANANGSRELNLTLPDGTVAAYRATAGSVERVLRGGNETRAREFYRLNGSGHRFAVDGSDPVVVALVQTADPPAASTPDAETTGRRVVRIEAIRGRDHHVTTSKEN